MSDITIFKHIKASQLPAEWLRKIGLYPEQFITVTIELENEDSNMPEEEMISDKLIEAVKYSEESYKKGDFICCKTKEERIALFQKILKEDDE
ncbi:hypothetical protein MCHI_000235 [Candidatus Magnetoovum chiemensis]|nr:hypothetical protein MCHI_000235 [Candidatus Magnetoovum chiemensis]